MGIEKGIYRRTELLLGGNAMQRLASQRVIIFGVGGVGSWCAESLVRTGITQLTIVDSDRICVTNVNRQLMATTHTVGRVKVDALKERLLEINPTAQITAVQEIYTEDTADNFQLDDYDYVVDAIDSLKDKALLIMRAAASSATLFSSMGAALKIDPTRIKIAEFWKVKGDPLGSILRKRLRRAKLKPAKKFLCVYSDEVMENHGFNRSCGTEQCLCPKSQNGPGRTDLLNHEWCTKKAQINGTTAHITAIFGFTLAGLIIEDVWNKLAEDKTT